MLKTASLREATQAALALIVIITSAGAIFASRVLGAGASPVMPAEWWGMTGIVVGYYFGRTSNGNGAAK